MSSTKKILVIAATTAETFNTILKGQPEYLSGLYRVVLICDDRPNVCYMLENSPESVIEYRRVPMKRGIHPIFDCYSLMYAYFVLKHLAPDLVQTFTPKAGFVIMSAAWCAGVRVRVHTFTGLVFPTARGVRRALLRTIDKITAYFASNVIPESLGVARLLASNEVTTKPLELIGDGNIAGVDCDYYTPTPESQRFKLRAELGIAESDLAFLFVGRVNKDKGIEELTEVFSNKRSSSDVMLIVVGSIDKTNSPSNRALSTLRHSSNIRWMNFTSDLRSIYAVADVLILPSYREGFPNVLLEAAACGLPAVVTNVPGSADFVQHDVNGWIAEPMNLADLEAKVNEVIFTSRDEIRLFGRSARRKARISFDRRRHLERLQDFYESLM